MAEDYSGELVRLDLRNNVEYQPLDPETGLRIALGKVPGQWTKAMCEALHLPVSSRDPERKAAIHDYLISPESMPEIWRELPEESRRIVSWLVIEKGGSSSVRELYDEFGVDDDYAYFWNKGERPTTALGLLRLRGLVFKGMTKSAWGRVKVVAVPVELREELASVAGGAAAADAPPMPETAFRKRSGKQETLEIRSLMARSRLSYKRVFQFMIVLEDVSPAVWRRIQVPENYSFWDLHVAVQDSMGWLDYHLHEFRVPDPGSGEENILGFPDEEFPEDRNVLRDYTEWICDYFSLDNTRAGYLYDFGDCWHHEIALEAIFPRKSGSRYPTCTGGERACPPEDCGGPGGYQSFLRIIGNPADEEYEETIRWVGGAFNPKYFDPSDVRFDDPQLRWSAAFLDDDDAYEALMEARPDVNRPPVPVTYTNRRGELYYLHSRQTKTGGTAYHFSGKKDGTLVHEIPGGFEVYEKPDGRVYLRRCRPEIITGRERRIVESAVKAGGVKDCIVDIKDNVIIVFTGDLDEKIFSGLLGVPDAPATGLPEDANIIYALMREIMRIVPIPRPAPAELLKKVQTYTPVLRFTLEDEKTRSFTPERACFMGGMDEWISIGGPGDITALANRFSKHLGRDSFYELGLD